MNKAGSSKEGEEKGASSSEVKSPDNRHIPSFVERHAGAFLFAGVTIAVYLTRLPVIAYGPGRDPDAWRLLNAGISIAETGRYTMSRPPGHPVPEYIYSLYTNNPMPFLYIVAVLGAAGVAFFALTARRLGCRDYLWAALAVGMTPVVMINGANVMDYTWAFAFVMAAFYFVVNDRPIPAGVLTGIAAGSRITAGAMLIPFTVLLLFARRPIDRRAIRQSAKLWIAGAAVTVMFYVPVFLNYGGGAMRVVDEPRSLETVLRTIGTEIWGSVGLIAIAIGLGTLVVMWFVKPLKNTSIPVTLPEYHGWVWLAVIAIYAGAFARLPHEAGYLILTVPFIVLYFARYVGRPVFIIFCVLLALSPAVHVGKAGFEKGPARVNRGARGHYAQEVDQIIEAAERQGGQSVVVAGWLAPQLNAMWYYRYLGKSDQVIFEDTLADSIMAGYVKSGRDVYVLPNPVYYHDLRDPERLLRLGAGMLYYYGDARKNPAGGAVPRRDR